MTGTLENPKVPYAEFYATVRKHMFEKAFGRQRLTNDVQAYGTDYESIIPLYEGMISLVGRETLYYEEKLDVLRRYKEKYKELEREEQETGTLGKSIADYGEDLRSLETNLSNELARQAKYLSALQAKLADARALTHLFSLSDEQLLAEAKSNKASVQLILKTPQLLARIPDEEFANITHNDGEIARPLAKILTSREYTLDLHNKFLGLQEQLSTSDDLSFITQQEADCLTVLLRKIDAYIDGKIERAQQEKRSPWALGYFGSRYKWEKGEQQISVPQGIYELKTHLKEIGKIPPQQILDNLKTTIQTKLNDIEDDSFFNLIRRFVNYLFGCARSQETISDYRHISTLMAG